MNQSTQQITLAGGCFWCIESAFSSVMGIERVQSGYMGGHVDNPSYELVCQGTTGHAEVVQLTFDNTKITVREILEIFFSLHNPTEINRQGYDVGSHYRSAIFYHDSTQKMASEQIIAEINEDRIWPDPVVTQVNPAHTFYQAEDKHNDYYNNNPKNQYCQMVISPKLAKFKQTFATKLA